MGRKKVLESEKRIFVGLRLPAWLIRDIKKKYKIETISDFRKFVESLLIKQLQ